MAKGPVAIFAVVWGIVGTFLIALDVMYGDGSTLANRIVLEMLVAYGVPGGLAALIAWLPD